MAAVFVSSAVVKVERFIGFSRRQTKEGGGVRGLPFFESVRKAYDAEIKG